NTDSVSTSAERQSASLACPHSDPPLHAAHAEEEMEGEARLLRPEVSPAPRHELFVAEADKIAEELSARAIRAGSGAAWIGIDWLGDSEVSQLVALGPDLYNGSCGIAVFLAAHSAVTGYNASKELALAGIANLRKQLRSPTSARLARLLGTGGAV